MNEISGQNELDVISFTYNRPDRLKMNLSAGGLSSLKNVPQLLKDGKYIEILKSVWMESNQSQLLEFLRTQPQIHAPLLAERAIAELISNPTVETIIQVSLPLIKAAEFRTMQDAKGVNDGSLQSAHMDLSDGYLEELNNICKKELGKKIGEVISSNKEKLAESVKNKVMEIASLTLSEVLPSSEWVAMHGMNAYMGKIEVYSEKQENEIKKEFANQYIATNKTVYEFACTVQ